MRLSRLLLGDFRTFIRQEVKLAKTEMSEKVARMSRNGIMVAVGGLVAYAGLIVFLIGLSWLIAWLFELAGVQPVMAGFLGLAIVGSLVIAIGSILLLKGLKTLSRERLAPQRTLHTLHGLKGSNAANVTNAGEKSSATSAEMQLRVEATENRMGETLDELGYRLSPQHINAEVKEHIRRSPYRSGAIAMGAGLVSGLLLRNKLRRT